MHHVAYIILQLSKTYSIAEGKHTLLIPVVVSFLSVHNNLSSENKLGHHTSLNLLINLSAEMLNSIPPINVNFRRVKNNIKRFNFFGVVLNFLINIFLCFCFHFCIFLTDEFSYCFCLPPVQWWKIIKYKSVPSAEKCRLLLWTKIVEVCLQILIIERLDSVPTGSSYG